MQQKDPLMETEAGLNNIAHILLHSDVISNYGLLQGKTGMAIFYNHYARYTGQPVYEKHAGLLIDEIYESLDQLTSTGFLHGLSGIGWAFQYLAVNGFMDDDTDFDDAFSDVDAVLFQLKQERSMLPDKNDLFGYGLYYLARLYKKTGQPYMPYDLVKEQVVVHLTDACEKMLINKGFLESGMAKLRADAAISIAFFLLKCTNLPACRSKAIKLLQYVPCYLQQAINTSDEIERITICKLTKAIMPFLQQQQQTDICMQLIHTASVKMPDSSGNAFVSGLNKAGLYYLVYPEFSAPEIVSDYITQFNNRVSTIKSTLYMPDADFIGQLALTGILLIHFAETCKTASYYDKDY